MTHELDADTIALYRFNETVQQLTAGNFRTSFAETESGYDLDTASHAATPLVQGGMLLDGSQYCRWFNGTSQYFVSDTIDAPMAAVFTASYTLEFWVYVPELPSGDVYLFSVQGNGSTDVASSNYLCSMRLKSDGTIDCFWEYAGGDNENSLSTGTVTVGGWTHVAIVVTIDGTADVAWYFDAVTGGTSGGLTPTSGGSAAKIYAGAQLSGSITGYFNGGLRDVRLSNVARSAPEIVASVAADEHADDASTYEIWRLGEAPECASEAGNLTPLLHLNPASAVLPDIVDALALPSLTTRARYSGAAAGEYLITPVRPDLAALLVDEWSLEFWARKADVANAAWTIMDFSASGETLASNVLLEINFGAAGGAISFWEHGAGVNVESPESDAVWDATNGQSKHHIAYVKQDAGGGLYDVLLYVDGAFVVNLLTAADNAEGGSEGWLTVFAHSGGAGLFKGVLDDMRLSSKARSAEEVLASHNAGTASGVSAEPPDAVAPVVDNFAPTNGSEIEATDPITFDTIVNVVKKMKSPCE